MADRPKPLWRPIGDEDEEPHATSSADSKPSVANPSQGETPPPSPRTLQAIQAAMNDSSDEETVDQVKKDGSLSPRTVQAIQRALMEEEDGSRSSHIKSAPQVVISSSEEDTQSSPKERRDLQSNLTGQSPCSKDILSDSSSEDEMEEIIGQRNKALRLSALQQPPDTEKESENGHGRPVEKQIELEQKQSEHKSVDGAAESSQNTLAISLSPRPCRQPDGAETDLRPVLLEQRKDKLPEAPEKAQEVNAKSENAEESESEGTSTVSLINNCSLY